MRKNDRADLLWIVSMEHPFLHTLADDRSNQGLDFGEDCGLHFLAEDDVIIAVPDVHQGDQGFLAVGLPA